MTTRSVRRLVVALRGVVSILALGPVPALQAQEWPAVSLRAVLGGLQRPTHVTHAGDGSGRLFVSEQGGRIRIVRDGALLATPFLDIRSRVGEALNGMAFAPGYGSSGRFYVQYQDASCDTIVARYRATADPDRADPASEEVLLRVPSAGGYCGHDGGAPVFGPDGYLYVSLGDGTVSGVASDLAQDPSSLRGKLLRIDVEGPGPAAYAIPPTNPFVGMPGVAPEVWALGLRNPWRMAFAPSGDLYIADVGQGRREEINVQEAGSSGGQNYGWKIMEGSLCFGGPCTPSGFTLPVVEYDHGQGCSVTGGTVYRGPEPALQGLYLYGDFCSGTIWGLERREGLWASAVLGDTTLSIVTFGEAEDGTLLVADYAGGGLYAIAGTPPTPVDLAVAHTASVSAASGDVTYTVRVVNESVSAATGLVVSDTLPAEAAVVSTTPTASACVRDGRVVTCRLVQLGGGAEEIITIIARPTASGTVTSTVSAVASEPDPDPSNNTASATASVTSSKDLVITSLKLSAASAQPGQNVTVSYRVSNAGGVTVTETYAERIYLSSSSTLEAGGAMLLGQSRDHTSDLAAGAGINSSQAVVVPPSTTPGAYYILVQADALTAVDEGAEGNNVTAITLTVQAPPPVIKDLVIVSPAVSIGTVRAGERVTISYGVKNVGTSTVTETFTERIHLSSNSTWEAEDLLLATSPGHTGDLKPGATLGYSMSVVIPVDTAPGPYSLLVQADALAAVAESNEYNNLGAVALTVNPPPAQGKDLVIENLALGKISVRAGTSLALKYRVVNRGTVKVTETFAEKFFLSLDPVLDAADAWLGTSPAHTADLAVNGALAHVQTVVIPPGTAPGTYYVVVQADVFGAVAEGDEGNNTAVVPLTVTP